MLDLDDEKLEELAETLYDLKHDLGKYIKFPLAMLPKDASIDDIRNAVVKGIEQTRKSPRGVRSAMTIINEFNAEWGDVLKMHDGYLQLQAAVRSATAWGNEKLQMLTDASLRPQVMADFEAVSDAIAALLAEVENG